MNPTRTQQQLQQDIANQQAQQHRSRQAGMASQPASLASVQSHPQGRPGASSATGTARTLQPEALLNPRFVAAVHAKIQSKEFATMAPEAQRKLLMLQRQIQAAAAMRAKQQVAAGGGSGIGLPTATSGLAQGSPWPSSSTLGTPVTACPPPLPTSAVLGSSESIGGTSTLASGSLPTSTFSSTTLSSASTMTPPVHSTGVQKTTVAPPPPMPMPLVGAKRPREETEVAVEDSTARRGRRILAFMSDTARALRPDYSTPFSSTEDVCQRLLAYHKLVALGGTNEQIKTDVDEWKPKYEERMAAAIEKAKAIFAEELIVDCSNGVPLTSEESCLAAVLERYDASQSLRESEAKRKAESATGEAGSVSLSSAIGSGSML